MTIIVSIHGVAILDDTDIVQRISRTRLSQPANDSNTSGDESSRSLLLDRLQREMSSNEFLERALRLPVEDREWLALECHSLFKRLGKTWYAEIGDVLTKSFGFSSMDAWSLWLHILRSPASIDDWIHGVYPDDLDCLLDHCQRQFELTCDVRFLVAAERIANAAGYPSPDDRDWGPYADGESGPSAD